MLRWLRRVAITVVCIHAVVFCWSIYRRIWQVQRIGLVATDTMLHPLTVVGYDVITSGEVRNLVRFELVQGTRQEILREWRTAQGRIGGYDVRLFRYTRRDTVGARVLSRFQPGPAVLRLTVFGGPKLLRTPAPRVRELQVRVASAEEFP